MRCDAKMKTQKTNEKNALHDETNHFNTFIACHDDELEMQHTRHRNIAELFNFFFLHLVNLLAHNKSSTFLFSKTAFCCWHFFIFCRRKMIIRSHCFDAWNILYFIIIYSIHSNCNGRATSTSLTSQFMSAKMFYALFWNFIHSKTIRECCANSCLIL